MREKKKICCYYFQYSFSLKKKKDKKKKKEIQLIYNIVLVSGVQQSDSVIYTFILYIFIFLDSFHYRLLQENEYGSCTIQQVLVCLFIYFYIVVCIFYFILLFYFFDFLSFQGHTHSIWKFPCQGQNRSYSCQPTPQPQQCRI